MKQIQYCKLPREHIIIDNFLPAGVAKQCLEEAVSLEKFYKPAKVFMMDDKLDDCSDCQKLVQLTRKMTRENDIVYMDDTFENKRNDSVILSSLHFEIQRPETRSIIEKMGGMFKIIKSVTNSETILSRYGMCDFYDWHYDIIPENLGRRILTIAYYFNKEPPTFVGGELLIAGDTIDDVKIIEPKHNRAVIFESSAALHSVNYTKLNGSFEEGRFSANFWLGFTSPYNFR